jgi:hypothetical protein
MQKEDALSEIFDRLRGMRLPPGVFTEYDSFLASIGSMDGLTA